MERRVCQWTLGPGSPTALALGSSPTQKTASPLASVKANASAGWTPVRTMSTRMSCSGLPSNHLQLGDLEMIEENETAAANHYLQALSLGAEMEAEGIVMTALTNLAARLLKRGDAETAVFTLLTVQKQPSITDSLRRTVVELLAQESAVLSEARRIPVESKALESTLETAVAKIQQKFSTSS